MKTNKTYSCQAAGGLVEERQIKSLTTRVLLGIYEQNSEASEERCHSESSTLYIQFFSARKAFFALGSACSKKAGISGRGNEGYKDTMSQTPPRPQAAGAGALSGAAAWPDGGAGTRRVGV